MIFHIMPQADWSDAQHQVTYQPVSLDSEGFIHCSTREQLVESATLHFHGQSNLVVLCIDEPRVEADIRYENLTGGTPQFPHIYGPLNADAIVDVLDLPQTPNGAFQLPPRLA
ncbi:MAG: DUF952 domain-containing protein [Candidatus Tectomicrobia bacterium]|nr:DUF952 domain-containing protein [Candidatus Tectomicrobia bacterium]